MRDGERQNKREDRREVKMEGLRLAGTESSCEGRVVRLGGIDGGKEGGEGRERKGEKERCKGMGGDRKSVV